MGARAKAKVQFSSQRPRLSESGLRSVFGSGSRGLIQVHRLP